MNTRCGQNPELLFDRARYVAGLSQLRPDNDNVLFVTLAGIPPELVSEEAQAAVNFSDAEERDAYYDAILAAPAMQDTVVNGESDPRMAYFAASCMKSNGNGARPPRRLVQVAKDFGERGWSAACAATTSVRWSAGSSARPQNASISAPGPEAALATGPRVSIDAGPCDCAP